MQEFELRVLSTDNYNLSLELYQCASRKAGEKKRPSAKRIGGLKGNALVQAKQAIYDCFKANNYDPKTLSHNRQSAYILDEESATNLALLFQTLQPLSKPDRVANITKKIIVMSNEESHYWFAKISNGKRSQALRAIRVLLGD
ncbi:hypothetical protein OGM63_02475 [Plectonema radiosum NIES-515]|uniref:DUF7680 domain-containing protein n=1 Tax=Plectonema radiosum NIES-515 TaxID=2986073 RepID=A0ABT3ATF8_9CYAN|nr:hypothetical protein [Plectonema radiosum]MCV3212406.1 hypothetical protein [Plectonema radiosum NIES-515]